MNRCMQSVGTITFFFYFQILCGLKECIYKLTVIDSELTSFAKWHKISSVDTYVILLRRIFDKIVV